MNKPIFRDFDLPTMQLEDLDHFVPPKARAPYEIARRRELPKGALVAEHQKRGLIVAKTILENVEDPTDVMFASKLLATCSVNTAWYTLARNAPVMRRRLKLPILAEEDRDYAPDRTTVQHGAIGELDNAASYTDRYLESLGLRAEDTKKHRVSLGRVVGNASLTLACLTMDDRAFHTLATLPDDLIQQRVRKQGLKTLHTAQMMGEELGTIPSLAQLAIPDSDLGVFWRRNAPEGAFEAYELAIAN